ncbi:MAG: YlxR family protein [Anaerolineae bacterium]|nr:YlxR family protein [Anaerolineae bacterium]
MPTRSRPKHVPQRTCVVCRTTDAKRRLTRLVRTTEAGVQMDPTGKRAGRGAYLCDNPACWQQAIKGEVLNKALRTTLSEADRAHIAAAAPPLAGEGASIDEQRQDKPER